MITLTLWNKSTDFTTPLYPPIRLEPNKNYEAAFKSLHTYNTLPNITEANNNFIYSSDKGANWTTITLPKGAYEFDEINDAIQLEMKKNNQLIIMIK